MKEPKLYRFSEYYIGFGGGKTYWWTKFLKKGFRHCFLMIKHNNKWLVIDHIMAYTDVAMIEGLNAAEGIKNKGYVAFKVKPNRDTNNKLHIFRPFTCVETVKHFLGISNPWIFTPYQLYKYLKKKGKIDA